MKKDTGDSANKAIEILTGKVYVSGVTGKSSGHWGNVNCSGTLRDTKVVVDGKVHNITVFNTNGSTYFKLRDLSKLVDLEMEWDSQKDLISLYSKLPENAHRVQTAYDSVDHGDAYPRSVVLSKKQGAAMTQ